MQREEKPVMATGLERIAVKARNESKLGSLDHGWLLRFVELRVGVPRRAVSATATKLAVL